MSGCHLGTACGRENFKIAHSMQLTENHSTSSSVRVCVVADELAIMQSSTKSSRSFWIMILQRSATMGRVSAYRACHPLQGTSKACSQTCHSLLLMNSHSRPSCQTLLVQPHLPSLAKWTGVETALCTVSLAVHQDADPHLKPLVMLSQCVHQTADFLVCLT